MSGLSCGSLFRVEMERMRYGLSGGQWSLQYGPDCGGGGGMYRGGNGGGGKGGGGMYRWENAVGGKGVELLDRDRLYQQKAHVSGKSISTNSLHAPGECDYALWMSVVDDDRWNQIVECDMLLAEAPSGREVGKYTARKVLLRDKASNCLPTKGFVQIRVVRNAKGPNV